MPAAATRPYDEALRVPMVVKGPGVAPSAEGTSVPTSHVDVIPTLLGPAGVDVERATAVVGADHTMVRPFPGRDLSAVLTGATPAEAVAAPIYFMTDDDVTSGVDQRNVLTGEPFESLAAPARLESVVATLPTGDGGGPELWELNHYHDGLPGPWAGQAPHPIATRAPTRDRGGSCTTSRVTPRSAATSRTGQTTP